MKQSAIDFLIQNLSCALHPIEFAIVAKAKEMERQQIIEAHGKQFVKIDGDKYDWINGEQYFNKIYNNEQ